MSQWRNLAETMVQEQILARGIFSNSLLDAMRSVPRHLFIPPSLREYAWIDRPLPIGENQTISQPYMVARMTELLAPISNESILEIGTGSGYQAAILSAMGAKATSLERVRALADRARETLSSLGYDVEVVWSDGEVGTRPSGAFAGVIVTAAAPILEPWWSEILLPGGRLVVPLSVISGGERLFLRKKGSDGSCEDTWHDYCRFVPLLKGRKDCTLGR